MAYEDTDIPTNTSNMSAVIQSAREGVKLQAVEGVENLVFVPTPAAREDRILDLQKYAGVPRRKSGVITVFDTDSFNKIMAQNADAGVQRVYVDRDVKAPKIVGVMNDHGETKGWRDFLVQLELRETPQWKKWQEMDGQMVGQTVFAEFIEDNLQDVAQPEGATMLEIVTYLQATRTVEFKSGIRLSNGQVQFEHTENTDARVGVGRIEVPETFMIALMPFHGSALYRVPARFRYRLNDGKLTLGLKLQRIESLMDEVINEMIKAIKCENIVQGKAGAC